MDSENFIKMKQNEDINQTKFLGNNIAFSNGKEWEKHRKVINPVFKKGWDINIFIKTGIKMINYMKINEDKFELITILKNSTLDALGLSIFDIDFNSIEDENCELALLYIKLVKSLSNLWFLLFPFLDKLPIPSRVQLKKDAEHFRQLIKSMINEKREQINKLEYDKIQSNLLTMLIQSSDTNDNDNSDGLTDEEIINDVIIFFIAGHDTTAHTISTILYYLAKNQDVQAKLRNEINQVLGKKSKNIKDIKINQEELNKMVYLEAVITEGMRIVPVSTLIIREVSKDINFNNEIRFKKGQLLMLNLLLAMNNDNEFKNPEEFNPDRFLINNDNNEQAQINKKLSKDMITFGFGSRMCTGSQFSILEQKVYLILLLISFKIELPFDSLHHNYPVLPAFGIVSPKDLKLNFIAI
ncbi:cytochrome P450 [Neoconidiobolus thromboides FSU 785]|nr:cytochrome P450 [Neoconidiobolus thromboides FSU 785]